MPSAVHRSTTPAKNGSSCVVRRYGTYSYIMEEIPAGAQGGGLRGRGDGLEGDMITMKIEGQSDKSDGKEAKTGAHSHGKDIFENEAILV